MQLSLPIRALLVLVLTNMAAPLWAASSAPHASQAVQARLVAAEDGVAPEAGTVSAGLDITLKESWKTYWRSPGEVGLPPEIDWAGSENVADVEMLWPAPERFRAFGIENFGYDDEVVFPLQVTLERPGEPVRLNADVELLVCADICVPETFSLALNLPAGGGIDPVAAERIATFADRVPGDGPAAGVALEAAALDGQALTVQVRSERPLDAADVFPEQEGASFGAPDIRAGEDGRLIWARLPVLAEGAGPLRLTLTGDGRAATLKDVALQQDAPAAPFARAGGGAGPAKLASVALIAVLGGLILNVMPCVLPVLSIKLSSAMAASGRGPGDVRRGFLMSALGVMAFMWVLAAATLGARAVGLSVGWGLQFQSPIFLAAMILVLALFAANMLGLFEITLPSRWQTRLARADGGGGHAGDFATGAFAAVLATPCSAPFLGTAVAVALAGRAVDVAVIFTALGLGLALPYLAVAAAPGTVRMLPKPGRWMLVVRGMLGALLALTAAWLFWVLIGVAGGRVAALVGAAVALALALLWQRRRLSQGALAAALAGLAALALIAPLVMPAPERGAAAATDSAWVAFDRGEIARRVSQGETVFVDVTADWCLTCKANKSLVLDRAPVAAALAGDDVTAMRADWTRADPAISQYLESFDRYGIPFNAAYGPGAPEGLALSEVLSAEEVLAALDRAAGE